MRKHSVRKWLHAILDLLPVFLIPVFMIYSHRHTLTDVTNVDIQYKYQSNEVNDSNDIVVGNIYRLNFANNLWDTYFSSNSQIFLDIVNIIDCDFSNLSVDFNEYTGYVSNGSIRCELSVSDYYGYLNFYLGNDGDYFLLLDLGQLDENSFTLIADVVINEFSYQTYITELPFSYTDFNIIESVQVDDTASSITDVFIDNFTHTVNTKFNFSSAFNFNDLWHWLDTNLFGGQNSQVMYAIYNIVVYEFLMDVLFIIYCLFMFIVDFAESCLDRPFNVTKRGK